MSARRVLVVEDSPAQAELAVSDLRDAGYEVRHAPDGEAALALLAGSTFDLVLSDVVMPGIDGYELCRRIKDATPEVPVILMTSLDDPMEIVHALGAGADNFLRKPYDRAQLLARVQAMANRFGWPAAEQAGEGAGLEVLVRDRAVVVTAERQQILHLLVSSFEDLVSSNRELQHRELVLRATQAEVRQQLAATERERRRLTTVLGAAPQAMVILDADASVTDVSDELCELLGTTRADLLGRPVHDVVAFSDAAGRTLPGPEQPFAVALAAGAPVELGAGFDLFLELGGGVQVPVITRTAPVHDEGGGLLALVGAIQEIGALASRDVVTGLPDQAWFADRVADAVASAAERGEVVAVIAIVAERLARLREGLTAATADDLSAQVAARLRAALADPALAGVAASAAAFGHDLFAVVVPHLGDELEGRRVAEVLSSRLGAAPLALDGLEVVVPFALGVAVEGTVHDPVRLVSAAVDAARRGALGGGGGVVMADPEADARAEEWLRRQAELRAALGRGELVVHYHPVLDLRTGRPTGVEALVRWEHPVRGLLAPAAFLPLAVDAGLVAEVGWWVLEEASRTVARWRAAASSSAAAPTLSVNVDAQQLEDPDVAAHVGAILARTGLDPTALVVEVTERGVLGDPVAAAERLRALKALGVRIAIDDFGTGASSLVQLRRFPVDVVKIDPSFVRGMTDDAQDAAIVAAIARLARALGIDAVAEGVEREEQLVQLRLLGCDLGQGFLWTRPLPADAVEGWMAAHTTSVADGGAAVAEAPPASAAPEAALDEVVAYLVHELRSPLTVIRGFAELALDGRPEDAEVLEPIVRSAADIERRIAMLTDMRTAGQGAMRLELAQLDVGEVVETLVRDMTPQLQPHPVAVEVERGLVARVDRSRLGQAITNLLVNAAKFSEPDAAIEVRVAAAGAMVRIAVRDHGVGVPEERRPELFRRFARLGSRAQGMGVGLHLVRAIARAHGGDAHHEPADVGSCFVVTVPRA